MSTISHETGVLINLKTLPAINEPTYISALASAIRLNCILTHRLFVVFALRTIGTTVAVVFSFSGLMKYERSDATDDSSRLVAESAKEIPMATLGALPKGVLNV